RFHASVTGKSTTGLVIDVDGKLGPFVSAQAGEQRVTFLPGLVVVGREASPPNGPFGFVALVSDSASEHAELVRKTLTANSALLIVCVDRDGLAQRPDAGLQPDIVVFDETFVNREVPFGAFSARKAIYDHWNKSTKSTFHSTT